MRRLRSDFVRHGLIVFGASMLVGVFSYVFHFVVSRKLGVTNYGVISSLFAVMMLFGVPTNVLTMIVVRYAAEFRAVGDLGKLASLSRWVVSRTAAIAVAVIAIGALAAPAVARYLNIDQVGAVAWTAVLVALGIVLPGLRGVLQGVEDFGGFAVSTVIEGLLKVVIAVGFVYLGFGVTGAVAGYALAIAIGIAYTVFAVRRHLAAPPEPMRLDTRRLILTSAGVTLSQLAISLFLASDLLLVKHLFSPSDAGLYGAVSLVGKTLLFVVGFIPTLVLPKATARAAAGAPAWPLLVQAAASIAAICGAGLVVLYVAPALVVRLMVGPAFGAAAPLVFEYGVAMTILGATSAVVAYNVAVHRFGFVPWLLAVAAAEIVLISQVHPSLLAVIRILIAGHGVALAVSLSALPQRRAAAAVAVREAAA